MSNPPAQTPAEAAKSPPTSADNQTEFDVSPLPLKNKRATLSPDALEALVPKPQIPVVIDDVNTISKKSGKATGDATTIIT